MFRVTVLLRRARLVCIAFSVLGIVVNFATSSKMIQFTSYGTSWLALLVQIAVSLFQMCVIPLVAGMPMPQDIDNCLFILLMDWLAASFTVGMGWSLIWVALYMMPVYEASVSGLSLAYGCLVLTAGFFAEIGFLLNMLLAVKLRTPVQVQQQILDI